MVRLWKTPESNAYELLPTNEDVPQPDASSQSEFPRLSLPISQIRPEYDVVIVGSGYGAGVAASRMARAGKSVAVLELGQERWPGEYPRTFTQTVKELRTSGFRGTGEWGRRTALFHLVSGNGQNLLVGQGLGGTSLINANVFLRANQNTLQLPAWPREIRDDPECLDPYYERAAEMLQPTPYPRTLLPPNKLVVFEQQAADLGQSKNFYRVPLTTSFRDGLNQAGVQMKASTNTGQECTGVNDGSKNSVLVTYIADAWNWGAEIFCECEVRYIKQERERGGYVIFFACLGSGRQAFGQANMERLMWVRARELCILGAGTLGTTEILLRSQKAGLSTSSMVSRKFSGNGDILGFAYNGDDIVNGVARENVNPPNSPGPTITSVIDMRHMDTALNTLDGYIIQEGIIPGALAPLAQTMLEAVPGKVYHRSTRRSTIRRFWSSLKTRVFGPYARGGSLARTQTFLVMSHDSNEGIINLDNDKLRISFTGTGRSERAAKIRSVLAEASKMIGATFIDGPMTAGHMRDQTSVHPLGGATMSSDGTGRTGAVDHMGRLFVDQGSEVHPGLICVDAAVVPTSLAVNPLATITAMAERTCHLLLQESGLTAAISQNGALNLFGNPRVIHPRSSNQNVCHGSQDDSVAVWFTEVMNGYLHIGSDISDFEVAYAAGRRVSNSTCLCLTVDVMKEETYPFASSPFGLATGTLSCGALSHHPLMVRDGHIEFFAVDDLVSDATKMLYKLTLSNTNGEIYLLRGHKIIDSNMAFSIRKSWNATTTLYTTICHADGSVVGRGILKISLNNFFSQLRSLQKVNKSALKFFHFFAKNTASYFVAPLRALQYPDTRESGYFSKPNPAMITTLKSSDGIETPMRVWHPFPGSPQRPFAILFIPGASVDHQVFALPIVETNTIDYFTALGYTCYASTLRFGMLPVAHKGHTAYDARHDVRAAMDYVRKEEGDRKFYVVCHCLGSIATGMALLTGTVRAEWLAGMTCSQVFTDLRFGTVNRYKAASGRLVKAYNKLAGPWFPSETTAASPLFQRIVDQLLRFYPVGSRCEFCTSTVCHRCSLVFGRLWTHAKLNHATHLHITNFFSGTHMSFLSHLTRMGSTPPHHLRSNMPEFEDLVTFPGNLEKLEGLRIQFVSGGANVVFEPWSTERTYEMMRARFGPEMYSRVVVDGYGHLDTWMGQDSAQDVYPRVQEHLELCERVM